MPTWSKISLTNACSPQMEQILLFHDHTMMILTLIIIMIMYMLTSAHLNKFFNKFLLEAQELETIWTCLPAILLILIAFPSLMILYMMEETMIKYPLTLKISGYQWYWSYSLSTFNKSFNSMIMTSLSSNSFRLLDTNQHMILPSMIPARLLISSKDVIHSWTIPSMGVKVDAVPGRLNQIILNPSYSGLFFGQCSEICGNNHSFMPIMLEIIPLKSFINWLKF